MASLAVRLSCKFTVIKLARIRHSSASLGGGWGAGVSEFKRENDVDVICIDSRRKR